jgi:hypothetical protein
VVAPHSATVSRSRTCSPEGWSRRDRHWRKRRLRTNRTRISLSRSARGVFRDAVPICCRGVRAGRTGLGGGGARTLQGVHPR